MFYTAVAKTPSEPDLRIEIPGWLMVALLVAAVAFLVARRRKRKPAQ